MNSNNRRAGTEKNSYKGRCIILRHLKKIAQKKSDLDCTPETGTDVDSIDERDNPRIGTLGTKIDNLLLKTIREGFLEELEDAGQTSASKTLKASEGLE